jgi:FKBP-type peptidyl-prolyl cis-trans isomerase
MRSLAALLLLAGVVSCGSTEPNTPSDPATETYAASLGVDLTQMTKLTPDLYVQDKTVGTGVTAANGQTLTVAYTGYFVNGHAFDTSVGKANFSFLLGFGNVIEGWDRGLVGMKVGGTRLLVIGSSLGYGSAGSGSIPPNTTLVFTVQLLSAK